MKAQGKSFNQTVAMSDRRHRVSPAGQEDQKNVAKGLVSRHSDYRYEKVVFETRDRFGVKVRI